MRKATENLENDHVNILRLIDVMEKMMLVNSTNTEHFEKAVSLIREYADGLHHAKEETLLFPAMIKKGYSSEQGPVAVMLHDHKEGREYVRGMIMGISGYRDGNETGLAGIYENMQGYIVLLRNHISRENNILFPMANSVLSESDQQLLIEEFAKVDGQGVNGVLPADFIQEIDKLEASYK